MSVKRRKYHDHDDVMAASGTSWAASKATWGDPDNPTPAEEVAAKDARLAACIVAADILIAAE